MISIGRLFERGSSSIYPLLERTGGIRPPARRRSRLNGYNLMQFPNGDEEKSPRQESIYWTDDGSVAASRYNGWKFTFLRQNSIGFQVWEAPFEELHWPMVTSLLMDPFERAFDQSVGHSERATKRPSA